MIKIELSSVKKTLVKSKLRFFSLSNTHDMLNNTSFSPYFMTKLTIYDFFSLLPQEV